MWMPDSAVFLPIGVVVIDTDAVLMPDGISRFYNSVSVGQWFIYLRHVALGG